MADCYNCKKCIKKGIPNAPKFDYCSMHNKRINRGLLNNDCQFYDPKDPEKEKESSEEYWKEWWEEYDRKFLQRWGKEFMINNKVYLYIGNGQWRPKDTKTVSE